MEIIYTPRQSGKTTKMIEWLSGDKNRLLIVFNHRRKEDLKKQVALMDFHGTIKERLLGQIVTLRDYTLGYGFQPHLIKEVSIDDAELVLGSFITHKLKYMTISDLENDKNKKS